MGSVSKKTATKPPTGRQRMRDNDVLRLLVDHRGRSVLSLVDQFGVPTATIRLSLHRLTLAKAVIRERDDMPRRGKACYLYYITRQGEAALAKMADEEIARQKSKPRLIWG